MKKILKDPALWEDYLYWLSHLKTDLQIAKITEALEEKCVLLLRGVNICSLVTIVSE